MRLRLVVSLAVVASALAAPAAGSDGGPSPGALVGWTGVLSPIGTIRYAALATGRSTLVAAVEVEGGRVLDYRTIRGRYGIPLVADDGTTGGVSGDGSALVLAPLAAPSAPDGTTRFVVLLPGQRLLPWRTIALRGAFSFDAISPSGRFLYLVEYLPSPSGYATY